MQIFVAALIASLASGLLVLGLHLGVAGIIVVALAVAWGIGMAIAGAYPLRPLALLGLVLDTSWSLLNTAIGAVWLLICAVRGTLQPTTEDSGRSGTLVFAGAALPGADATTMANVIGGEWLAHEEVHVWQARLFGPLYWPIYLLSYIANLIVLLLTGRVHDLHWSAYGRDLMEDWAYLACPGDDINWGWWLLGLLSAAFFAFCLLLVLGAAAPVAAVLHVPHTGFLGGLAGTGLIMLFALVRSFLARTDPNGAPA